MGNISKMIQWNKQIQSSFSKMHKILLLSFLFYCSSAKKSYLVKTKAKEIKEKQAEYADADSSYSGSSESGIKSLSMFYWNFSLKADSFGNDYGDSVDLTSNKNESGKEITSKRPATKDRRKNR